MSVIDEKDSDRPRLVKTGEGYAPHIGAAIRGYAESIADTSDVLTRVVDAFPGVLLDVISGSPGMLPSMAAQLVDWARLALSITVKSVTVETQGAVTIVDRRTKPRCPDCDDSGLTDHDPALTRCATCGGK